MKKIFSVLIIWLICLYSLTVFLPQRTNFDYSYEKDSIAKEGPSSLWHLANFDGAHYQNIATWGYIAKFQTAFFPLYPLLTNLVGRLVGNYLLSGLAISLVCFLLSIYLLYQITHSSKIIVALIAFPLSFFLLANYTESLFLLLSLLAWFFFRRQKYWLTGIFGFLAATSRFYGCLLFPVFALDYFILLKNKRSQLSAYLPALPLLLIPLGLASYMLYLQLNFHDPLQFIHSLSLWNKSQVTLPPQTVFRYLKIFLTVSPRVYQYWIAILEFAGLLVGFSAGLILFIQKKYAFSLYLFLGSLIPTFTGTLQSESRYLLVLFPLFLLYDKIPKKIYLPLIIVSFGLQLLLFSFFLTGQFVA